jgi:hypothetical protein
LSKRLVDVAKQRIEEDRAKRMQDKMMYDSDQRLGTSTWSAERLAFEERKLAVEERRIEANIAIAKSTAAIAQSLE